MDYTLSTAMLIELHRAKYADIYAAENDDAEEETDTDIQDYEEQLNKELDQEAARSLNN